MRTRTFKGEYTDYSGRRFGKLLVLKPVALSLGSKNKMGVYLCKCDCGIEVEKTGALLLSSRPTASCGCSAKEHSRKLGKLKRTFGLSTINWEYCSHKSAGKRSGRGFLNRKDWESIVFKPCYYCGKKDKRNRASSDSYKKHKGKDITPEDVLKYEVEINGIDRVDSSKGYVLDNCVPCCKMCNRMKLNHSTQDFIDQCRLIVNTYDGRT
jgi:hypothetical protein